MTKLLVGTSRLDLAVENLGIGWTIDLQDADQAAFGAGQRVVDQNVIFPE
jgi:hypothetical protein